MSYRLKIRDLFRIGDKTVFIGALEPPEVIEVRGKCRIEVDGVEAGVVEIEGEVHTNNSSRDLWTKSSVGVCSEDVNGKDVWLISQ
jgi:hypothetical protein